MKLRKMRTKNKFVLTYAAFVLLALFALMQTIAFGQTNKNRQPRSQKAMVRITTQGFEPASVRLRRGVPARVTFLRTTDASCARSIVIPSYGINSELPLNQPVAVSITPRKTGEIDFACGMNMLRGKMLAR